MDSFDYLDDLFEPVLVADATESIVYFNPSFLTFFKTSPRAMNKQPSYKDYLCSIIPEMKEFLKELTAKKQMVSSEISFNHEGQGFTVIIKGMLKDSGHAILLFKDMTVEKQLNDKYRAQVEELKNTYAQVIQSDKLKVIGEMTANISHEINNPLTVAVGNVELISFALENEDLNPQRDSITKFHNNINHSLDRINKIITNMKEFLHKSEDKKEYCEAKDIVEKAISFVGPTVKGSPIQLNFKLNENPPIVLVNTIKIEQVFVNLIQNAIDALKEVNTKDPSVTIELTTDESGNFVHFDVFDNGPGISPENRAKIFETFFTTKEIGKGTGLGLSISNRIIESHQGKLELMDSKVGAHFRVTLPAIGIAGRVSGNWERLISEGETLKKVLVVDNEIHILNLCMNFLEDTNFYFLGASSAEEALKELSRSDIDLVLTDMKMPNVDGEQFVRELRNTGYDVPVLFMTSKDFIDKYKNMKEELKLEGIVLKPFTKDELISALKVAVK
jgi:signal transduction histidine kinase